MTVINSNQQNLIFKNNDSGLLFYQAEPPFPGLHVCVIVPVKNEAHHLQATLSALYHQVDASGKPLDKNTYEVLLLANNCTDRSAAVARNFQYEHPRFNLHIQEISLTADKANIGTARRMLMDEACRRLKESGHPNGIIASTDGDTVVDKNWVYAIMQEIAKGNDAVGGRILTHPNNSKVRICHLRDVMYRSLLARAETILDPHPHDPWPRHFQYFGASLAVTCQAYEQAGRLPEVPFLEDSAFHQALTMIDARIRKSNEVKVYTSARTNGRVEVGFSEQLNKWNDQLKQSKPQLVEAVEAQLSKLKGKQMLRQCFTCFLQTGRYDTDQVIAISELLMLPMKWLGEQVETSIYFGQLWQKAEQKMTDRKWNQLWPDIPITQAIAELRMFVSNAR